MPTTKTETPAVETAEIPAMVIRQPQPTQESWLKADGYIASLTDLFRQDPAQFRPEDREQLAIVLKDTARKFARKGRSAGGGPKGPGIGAFVAEQVRANVSPSDILKAGAARFPGSALANNPDATLRAHVGREQKLGHLTDEQVQSWRKKHVAPAPAAPAKAPAEKPSAKAASKKPAKLQLTARNKMGAARVGEVGSIRAQAAKAPVSA